MPSADCHGLSRIKGGKSGWGLINHAYPGIKLLLNKVTASL